MSKFTTGHLSPLHLREPREMLDHTSGYNLTHWLQGTSAPIPEYPQISKNESADVVVVGAGMGGLSVAYHLQNEGKSVIVLEDGLLMSGESGRTTAHLMSALDDKFYELERTFGLETAKLAYQSHAAAIDRIEEIVKKENIDCCFERLDGYLIQSPKRDIEYLKKEYEAAVRVGFKGVEWVNQAPVPGINTGECIRFPNQGQFNPVKYAAALARIITARGGKIFSHSKVTEFHTLPKHHLSTEDPYVITHNGYKVSYKDLAVCTNVPVNDRITFYTKMEPHRSYVVCAKIPKGTAPKCLVWDTSEPYNYVRTAEIDGDTLNDVLIIGGQDHKTGQAFDFDERLSALEKWARERWPTMGEIECYWSGQVIEPADMLQYIGRNPGDSKNVYVVTGDSGTGMTSTTIGGMLISDLIMGRTNPWTHIYDPSRKPVHAITEFVKINVTANVYGFGPYFTPSEVHDIEDIPKGCGALMREGVAKHAIYKDEQGNVTKLSSVCPHLKACVQWNSFEKSWDCPAHGSRFDPYGRVINGPANSNLDCLSTQPKPMEKATSTQQEQAHPYNLKI